MYWKDVEFDPHMTEEDRLWKPDTRESFDDLKRRIANFLETILVRHEAQTVVVVSHGVWIETCLRMLSPDTLKDGRRVYNCDAFLCDCISQQGQFRRLENVLQV